MKIEKKRKTKDKALGPLQHSVVRKRRKRKGDLEAAASEVGGEPSKCVVLWKPKEVYQEGGGVQLYQGGSIQLYQKLLI